jgi:hypothetical protein
MLNYDSITHEADNIYYNVQVVNKKDELVQF